jgi:hypothetical protein
VFAAEFSVGGVILTVSRRLGRSLPEVSMHNRRVPAIRLIAVVALLVLGAAACGSSSAKADSNNVASLSKNGSSSSGSTQKSTAASPAEFRKQLLAYAQCMRDNGVTAYPDPQFDANGNPQFNRSDRQGFDDLRNSPNFDKASTACESKRPDFGSQFQRTPAEQAAMRKTLLKYAKCMRSKGVDFPDPTFDANGRPQFTRDGAPGGAQGQNRDDPTFQAASQTCRQQVGGNLGRGPGGGGGPGGGFGGGRNGGNQAPNSTGTSSQSTTSAN